MDKLKITVDPLLVPKKAMDQILDEALAAGWSDDPGQGKAVLMKDARGNYAYEVHNPMPHAAPIGWEPTPPLDELIRDRVRAEYARLKDDEVIDTEEEANDFDVPDELPLTSVYEVQEMVEEAPALRKTPEQVAKEYLDTMELVERERYARKRAREQAIDKQRKALEEAEGELRQYDASSVRQNAGSTDASQGGA